MANHKSAEKRMRQNERRRVRNRSVRTQVKTAKKKMNAAIVGGDPQVIESQLRISMHDLQKAATKGVLKKKTASRQIGRLAKAVHKQAVAAQA